MAKRCIVLTNNIPRQTSYLQHSFWPLVVRSSSLHQDLVFLQSHEALPNTKHTDS